MVGNDTSCSIIRWLFAIYDLGFRNLASLRLAENGRRLQGRLRAQARELPKSYIVHKQTHFLMRLP